MQTISQVLKDAQRICAEDGLTCLYIYRVIADEMIADGFDKYIFMPYSVGGLMAYEYIGFVRADGTTYPDKLAQNESAA